MPQVFVGLLCSVIIKVFQDKRDLGNISTFDCLPTMGIFVATLLWPSVGVKPNTWKK